MTKLQLSCETPAQPGLSLPDWRKQRDWLAEDDDVLKLWNNDNQPHRNLLVTYRKLGMQ